MTDLSMEVCEDPLLCGVDEVLDAVLEPEPLELDGDQLVGRHHGGHGALKRGFLTKLKQV